jgi:DNA mismatch repair protein MutH
LDIDTTPPYSEEELLIKSNKLIGVSLGQIAVELNISIPENLRKHKGWVGELLESALGATAYSLPEPDFQHIGVELKSLPINKNGIPKESTFICTTPLIDLAGNKWADSVVLKKIKRVLWVPVESEPTIPLRNRRLGNPFLWSPDYEESNLLQSDWEDINEMISLGEIDKISSHFGEALQLRPKAASSKSETRSYSNEGVPEMTLPRGFYLRAGFTKKILEKQMHHQSLK